MEHLVYSNCPSLLTKNTVQKATFDGCDDGRQYDQQDCASTIFGFIMISFATCGHAARHVTGAHKGIPGRFPDVEGR